MEIHEFAERIVFGTTLDEKLSAPGQLTDAASSRTSHVKMIEPGRPAGLEMHQGQGLSQPPADAELEKKDARGRLLHFLANHELLATELMALVLIKFPDAPASFRRGVLVTLREEQEHTKLYLERMVELGVEFGSFPLSGHFWRVVEPMESPLDFVSRLSLTFEQANLDYSRHFAALFRKLGDAQTAEILERIYQDEIGHVRHGLQWFRQWKAEGQSDWEAYQRQLTFPMSPQRARGPRCEFNREGRRAAGLSPEFIDSVELFRQSRGRPPVVRWFDAAAEEEFLTNPSRGRESNRRRLGQLQIDLELLLTSIANQDDVQLVDRMPSMAFRRLLVAAGIDMPELILRTDAACLLERRLAAFEPWAWTPKNHRFAASFDEVTRQSRPVFGQQRSEPGSEPITLYRKSWAAARLRDWLTESEGHDFVDPSACGVMISDLQSVERELTRLGKLGFQSALLKCDFGTSGRGQRRFDCSAADALDRGKREWTIEDLGSVQSLIGDSDCGGVIEPELDRLVDMSFLWKIRAVPTSDATPSDATPLAREANHDAKFLGWTRQLITPGRRYRGCRLSRPFADCASEVKRFLLAEECKRLKATAAWLEQRLLPELRKRGFEGYFGVDALVCRWPNGDLRIKPLVELNPRMTMGHIALALRRRIAPATSAEFLVLTARELTRLKCQFEQLPLKCADDGRWESGVVRLSDPERDDRAVLAPVVLVGHKAVKICQGLG